jgi:hypothetical protein
MFEVRDVAISDAYFARLLRAREQFAARSFRIHVIDCTVRHTIPLCAWLAQYRRAVASQGRLRPSPPAIGTLDRRRLRRRFLTRRFDGLFWFFPLPFRSELLGRFRFSITELTSALQ